MAPKIKWGITCFFENKEEFKIVAELAPRYPLQYIEIRGERPFFSPDDISTSDLKFFQEILKESGLKATVHATFYDINLATVNSILKNAILECYKSYIEMSSQIGAEIMVLHAGHIFKDAVNISKIVKTARNNLIENLRILGDYAAERNVLLGLENSPPNPNLLLVANWENQIEMLLEVNHPSVRAVFDIAHAYLHGLDISRYYNKVSSYLAEIHIHNNAGNEDKHQAIDMGVIDYLDFFNTHHVQVPVIMEIRNFHEAVQSLEWIKVFEA